MWFLALACAFFLGIHLFTGGLRLKEQIVEGIGLTGYYFLFALFSIIGLLWMVFGYTIALADPLNIKFYHIPVFFHYLSVLPMMLAFILIVLGTLHPSPINTIALKRKNIKPVYGIIRISRHPILAGISVWAFTHLVLAGNMAAWLFFGTLLALTTLGANSIDRKRILVAGEPYLSIMKRTSIMPFNAIIEGRTVFLPEEFGIVKPLLALSMFALHEMLFAARVF
jgi:uncharacterized membrane protein